MRSTESTRSFLLGLAVSVVVLVSFFAGGLADRVFVIRPLDWLSPRSGVSKNVAENTSSDLGQLIQMGNQLSVSDVVAAASQSVVTVSIKKQQRVLTPSANSIFGLNFGQTELQEIQQDIGTGFIVGTNLIVTNKHVVGDGNATYKVIDSDDVEYDVTKMYRDPINDLAILEVKGLPNVALPLGDSEQIRVGESVIAIGTALGEFRHTVTTGVISGLGRGIEAGDGFSSLETLEGVIQTDAAINPGNSGGPLLNSKGEVIGVNVAVTAGAQNIGFAIPINVVKSSVQNFNETGQFDRPFLGVSYRPISEQAALFNDVPQGAYLIEVTPGDSAAAAGLQPGDIITAIDGELVKDQQLAVVLNDKRVGDVVTVRYWRENNFNEVQITLQAPQVVPQ
ncbi:MAG: trypsin-like serine protease [Candidatus Pacebacteria bacterium]|nr:trypsin-like serine protease [Candidatus Paceibacterota bacterium]PIR61091.1 MAG: hypothetical protein COU68_01210 [Candidatus Pacebacteria bacterium CG10_big_fil_rev_8_21_14_0_10_45_6]